MLYLLRERAAFSSYCLCVMKQYTFPVWQNTSFYIEMTLMKKRWIISVSDGGGSQNNVMFFE